jgi:Ca2+-binding RTX toxin-like protein
MAKFSASSTGSTIRANAVSDVLFGSDVKDVLYGLGGNDTIRAGAGADTIFGDDKFGFPSSDAGNDEIYAGRDNDWIYAGAGDDTVYGESGNDTITGGAGADVLNGGSGTDIADYLRSTAGVKVSLMTGKGTGGDAQGDTLVSIENIRGSGHADVLIGNDNGNSLNGMAGADKLFGNGGNDVLITGGGYDIIDGGAGTDTVSYVDSWAGVNVNLATGGRYGSASRDTYVSIERVVGSKFNDKLAGDTGKNRLTGGDGADTFIFNAKFSSDRIADFSEDDVILFNKLGFDSIADVLAAAEDSTVGAVITVAGHGKLTLMGVTVSQLSDDDFLFT